jgi:hypothetical protein
VVVEEEGGATRLPLSRLDVEDGDEASVEDGVDDGDAESVEEAEDDMVMVTFTVV